MQISKISLLFCALALGTGAAVRAADTPAQAAARAALEEKLKELDAQTPPPAAVEKAPAPKDVALKPVASETGTVDKAKQDAEQAAAELKAKKAAEKQAAELKAKQAAEAKKAEAAAAKAQASAKPVVEQPAPVVTPVVSLPAATADNEAQAKAREALAKELSQLPPPVEVAAEPAKPVASERTKPVKPVVAEPAKPAVVNYPGKDLGMKPIAAPALPINATKEEKLQALLAKYKADQLSPEEYHKQRAEILTEP